jgi:hypothetical protein
VKLAVIGSGAAAHAVLAEIRERAPSASVDVYDAPEPGHSVPEPSGPADYDRVYEALKRREGLSFPPPKSHFGKNVDSRPQAQILANWQRPGGLTNYWGATCLPFSDDDLQALGLSRQQLDPYYERVSALLNIAGNAESPLARRYQHRFFRAPAPEQLPLFGQLENAINDSTQQRFAAGGNCLALDTAVQSSTSCTYCGHCLAGCYRQALFCSAGEAARARHPEAVRYRDALVERVDLASRKLYFQGPAGEECSSAYDKVFIAAGCVQSTAIALRSRGLADPVTLFDNAIVQFAMVYTGPAVPRSNRYLALSQTLLSCAESDSLVQVYPFADHFLRTAVPEFLWPAVRPMAGVLRGRVLVGRLYLHSDYSHQYHMRLQSGKVEMNKVKEPELDRARPVISALGRLLRPRRFHVLGRLTTGTRTSSHFASTLADVADIPPISGRLADQVYCCDGAMFRFSPTLSPTFSIMANAARIAGAAL